MTLMRPRLRKFALVAHVTSSVGWLGAVAAFLALALTGLLNDDPQRVRGSYLAMEATAYYVIVPLTFASLVTGLIQGLGTTWGLFRHYWVLFKLIITVLSTILLLVHLQPIGHLADVAAQTAILEGEHQAMRLQLVADSAAAIVALLINTVLSIYKPKGLTPYGVRKERERVAALEAAP